MTVEDYVKALISYSLKNHLIGNEDTVYAANSIMDVLGIEPDGFFTPDGGMDLTLEDILKGLLDDAKARNRIEGGIASRDLLDTRLMGCVTPRPSDVIKKFRSD